MNIPLLVDLSLGYIYRWWRHPWISAKPQQGHLTPRCQVLVRCCDTCGCAGGSARFAISSELADDNDRISFLLSVSRSRPAHRSDTSRACYEIASKPPACLLCASCNSNPTARSSVANLPAAKSLPTQYSLIPGEKRRSSIEP